MRRSPRRAARRKGGGVAIVGLACWLAAATVHAQDSGYKPLVPPSGAEQDDGYEPLDPAEDRDGREDQAREPEPDLRDDEPFVPKAAIPRISVGGFFKTSYLRGRSMGHPDGEFVDPPDLDQVFRPGYGLGLTVLYSIVPMLAVQYDVSYQTYEGRRVSSGVIAGGSVDFGDLWVLQMDVGPRLQLPLELPSRFWDEAHSIPSVRGIVPFVRAGIGYSLSGDVDAEFSASRRTTYWSSTGSFYAAAALGTDIVGEHWGLRLEVVGIERWGPLDAAKSPEAKDVVVIAFPTISFGLTYRF